MVVSSQHMTRMNCKHCARCVGQVTCTIASLLIKQSNCDVTVRREWKLTKKNDRALLYQLYYGLLQQCNFLQVDKTIMLQNNTARVGNPNSCWLWLPLQNTARVGNPKSCWLWLPPQNTARFGNPKSCWLWPPPQSSATHSSTSVNGPR